MEENSEIPSFVNLNVNHYRQKFEWDCGLSCILMILSDDKRKYFLNNFTKICQQEKFKESTWTIDLCYLLKRFNVKHKYLTTVIGINPSYNQHSYYDKILSLDEQRINTKFAEAPENGILIEKRSVQSSYLIRHLAFHGPIILLTNNALLTCDICKLNKMTAELINLLAFKPSYNGHYIILCGYNLRVRKFFYRNPANIDKICVMPFDKMTKARQDLGTDEDIILIYKDKP